LRGKIGGLEYEVSQGRDIQKPNSKNKIQPQLLPQRQRHAPDHRQGQEENDKVGNDVDARIRQPLELRLETPAVGIPVGHGGKVPVGVDGDAEEDVGEEEVDVEDGDEDDDHLGGAADPRGRKDLEEEAQDGDLDGPEAERVGDDGVVDELEVVLGLDGVDLVVVLAEAVVYFCLTREV